MTVRHQALLWPVVAFGALLLTLANTAQAQSPEMGFETVRLEHPTLCRKECPTVIIARGRITAETPDLFADYLRANIRQKGLRNVVFVESTGGVVLSSMMLGLIWRTLGTTVIVGQPVVTQAGHALGMRPAHCDSACVYALMGAKQRQVVPGSRLEIHQMFQIAFERDPALGQTVSRRVSSNSQDMVTKLRLYARKMGVKPALIDYAQAIPSYSSQPLTPREITSFKLATFLR
jgi:hypothetical protein